jgi:hypothetical protein
MVSNDDLKRRLEIKKQGLNSDGGTKVCPNCGIEMS